MRQTAGHGDEPTTARASLEPSEQGLGAFPAGSTGDDQIFVMRSGYARRIASVMTFLLVCAALILLLTGHWGWALVVLLLLLLLSPSGKTSSGTGNTPSPKLASYAPEERHEHPAARVRRETTLTPLVRPSRPADADYGVDAFAFHDWLASPDVTGTPAGGLEADGTASGMAGYNVAAGVKGELSVAHMLASKDLKGARVYLSCRNPGDASGAADIDLIVATGRTVWLLDAKHYAPARDGM